MSHVLGLFRHTLGEGLEPFAVGLHNGNRQMPRLAHVEVADRSGLSFVSAFNDFAEIAIFYWGGRHKVSHRMLNSKSAFLE